VTLFADTSLSPFVFVNLFFVIFFGDTENHCVIFGRYAEELKKCFQSESCPLRARVEALSMGVVSPGMKDTLMSKRQFEKSPRLCYSLSLGMVGGM